jgi:hypothetical protein
MAFSRYDVLIATIKFGIGFLQNAGPKLLRILADCKYSLELPIDWQKVINHDVNLFVELIKSNHVSSFLVFPTAFALNLAD